MAQFEPIPNPVRLLGAEDYEISWQGSVIPHPHPTKVTSPSEGEQHSIIVDKQTHRIRFESETESSVVVVIEPKA